MGDRDIRTSDIANITYIRAHLDLAPQTLLDALGLVTLTRQGWSSRYCIDVSLE